MFTNVNLKEGPSFRIRFANWLYGGFYFALSFNLISYLGYAISAFNAAYLGYNAGFSLSGIDSLKDTTGWSVQKVAFVYVVPPLFALLTSGVALIAFHYVKSQKIHLRSLLFWVSFNGFLYYLSYIATGVASGYRFDSKFFTGFVGFYAWLGWDSNRAIAVLLVQFLISTPFVILFVKPCYSLSYSNRLLISRDNWHKFSSLLLIPIVVGILLVVLSSYPIDKEYQLIRLSSALVVAGIMYLFFNVFSTGNLKLVQGGLASKTYIGVFMLIVILVLSTRFLLTIRIGL